MASGLDVVDLRQDRLSQEHCLILKVLEDINVQHFNVNLDLITSLRYMRERGILTEIQRKWLRRKLRSIDHEEKIIFWRTFLFYLFRIRTNREAILNVLVEQGFSSLADEIKDGFIRYAMNFDLYPGADIPNADYVLKMYMHWKKKIDDGTCREDQLGDLSNRVREKMLQPNINDRDCQKYADQFVVLTRLRSQLCADPDSALKLIENMKLSVPTRVNTYFAEMVYHGRNIIKSLAEGDIGQAKIYSNEVEEMCLRCKHVCVRTMFHHRIVSVYRKVYAANPSEHIFKEIESHCRSGLNVVNSLTTSEATDFFELFFLLNITETMLGINVDFTISRQLHERDKCFGKAFVYLDNIERKHVKNMTPRCCMKYNISKARLHEFDDKEVAVEYIEEAIKLAQNGLIFPDRIANIERYRRSIGS
ncbi:uncharacterized protein LOC128240335 [Mya arenaria]|uniref:uncharacterized protein LOC128240335 n=1 Tax=Mya arenaria TaxID=6604 RepID=UPI0022E49D8B|nr:uncharacterized protein LOC128240335 [Mya arenaria]